MDIFGVVTDLFRGFAFFIDNVVYSLIPIVYKLFIYLSEINLFSMDDSTPIGALIGRIYVFLGIFMLFKVTFSLIQYLIDPSSFSDKSKGFGKLVTNAMVTILLLVSVPYIFNFAMKLQNTILTSNAIGTLIMGNSVGNINTTEIKYNDEGTIISKQEILDTSTVEEMATDVQFLMYGAFFSINPNAKFGIETTDEDGNKLNNACANTPIFGTVAMARNDKCLPVLKEEFDDENNPMARENVFLPDFFKTVNESGEPNIDRKFSSFGSLLSWRDDNGEYVINYLPFISAFAGIYVVFLLISFSVDIAVRAIKLCFLEMVAPIAIVSYIDPKESISNGKLHNWIKESLTTYFSLFLRLATLFLVMLLISVIASSVLAQDGFVSKQINDNEYNIWIYLFLVIGAFMFAKKVPQMIENIFGIKMSGELSLNPFKSAAVTGGIGGLIGAGIGTVAAVNEGRSHGEKGLRSVASGIGGAASGLARGAWAGGKGAAKGNWLKNSVRTGGDIAFSKESRREGGMFGTLRSTVAGAAGMPYEIDQYDKEIGFRQNVIDQASTVKKTAEDFVKNRSTSYKNFSEEIARASQTGKGFTFNGVNYGDANGISAAELTQAKNDLIKLQKTQAAEFGNTGMLEGADFRNSTDYVELQATLAGMREYTAEHSSIDGISQVTDYKSLMDVKDSASIANTTLKQSKAYDDAKRRKEIRQKYAKNDWVNEQRK